MNAHTEIKKIAVKRAPGYPLGSPAPMHMDCPCGTRIDLPRDGFLFPADRLYVCSGCGSTYDSRGWLQKAARTLAYIPGQEPHTPEELARLQSLVSDAAEGDPGETGEWNTGTHATRRDNK